MQAPAIEPQPALPWGEASKPALSQVSQTTTGGEAEQQYQGTHSSQAQAGSSLAEQAETGPAPVSHAPLCPSLATGEVIEVLWQIEEDGASFARWWKAVILKPCTQEKSQKSADFYTIRYEAYNGVAEEEADVCVTAPEQLHHVGDDEILKWRRMGDANVMTESEAGEQDDTVTLHELNEDGDELERDMGQTIEDAAMKHLQDNLSMDGQLRVAAGFRQFSDFIKQQLMQKQADEGAGHVVTSDDIADILQAFSNSK